MLILVSPNDTAVFLARIVMPFSRSRSIESRTRSATSWFSRNEPDCQSIASTSVVFPWSTCATIATLRSSSRGMRPGSATSLLLGIDRRLGRWIGRCGCVEARLLLGLLALALLPESLLPRPLGRGLWASLLRHQRLRRRLPECCRRRAAPALRTGLRAEMPDAANA